MQFFLLDMFVLTACLLVMELVDNGSLLKYLQKCRHENTDLSDKHLTLCLGVARVRYEGLMGYFWL